jgi:CRISPR/Cas system CSM-associated protein Csm2 small subunit
MPSPDTSRIQNEIKEKSKDTDRIIKENKNSVRELRHELMKTRLEVARALGRE